MIALLIDPWFEAQFIKNTNERGFEDASEFAGSDGLWLWCPCGYGKPEFPLDGPRPHGIIVSFANAPPEGGSRNRDGGPSRWQVGGTGLSDLTLHPSVDVGTPSCWHGWIQNGVVT